MPISNLGEAIDALYDLNVGVIGQGSSRHERPHKPVLLLAILDLIAQGFATPDRIVWSQQLRDRFDIYFVLVRKLNDQCTPENPFLYLRQEGWWVPSRAGPTGDQPLDTTPTVGDANSQIVYARLVGGMERFVIRPSDRTELRLALIARYFPEARQLVVPLFAEATSNNAEATSSQDNEDAASKPGRGSGFRRKILEIYDYQCAACGLRIKLPEVGDLTFVDAAHLIPFSVNWNDHPTNGIALCKNHHWAMDRFLIAPSPEGSWRVSTILDRRRSVGERDLMQLSGERILLPSEDAFRPCSDSLQWRVAHLVV